MTAQVLPVFDTFTNNRLEAAEQAFELACKDVEEADRDKSCGYFSRVRRQQRARARRDEAFRLWQEAKAHQRSRHMQ